MAFAAFLKEGTELVDSHSPWYRWKTRISGKELMDTLYEKLCDRYEQEPSNVQIRNKEGKFFSGQTGKHCRRYKAFLLYSVGEAAW